MPSMYIEMIRIRFLMMLAYRVNYYSGILVYSINIGAYYFLWNAIYAGQSTMGGLSSVQMTTYVAVAWMARAFYFNNIDREMAMEIKDGKVAIEMIRPYNYLAVKTMQALGEGLFRLLFFSVPGMLIVYFLFPIVLPSHPETWIWYAISLLFSFVINTELNLITGLLAFSLLNNSGVLRAKRVIVDLFSGLILPISFYPEWAQAVLEYLPFQAISYLPGLIFTEAATGREFQHALIIQGIWLVVLLIPLQVMWTQAKRLLSCREDNMFYVSLFFDYFKQYLKTKLAYRLDLVNEIVSDFIFQAVNLVFILVVFQHTDFIKGWSREEIIFIYGFYLIPYAVFTTFFNMWDFQERYIIKGEMDRILTRPAHNLFQVILETMDPRSLGGAVTGLIIMGYAAVRMNLSFAWYDPLVLMILVLSGALVYGGVYTGISAIGFFTDSKTGISPMIWNIQNYGRYPVDIYNKAIRFLLTWILPFAFVGVYPSSYFLKKEDLYFYVWLTPVMGILFFLIGVYVWNLGVRNYRGAGS